MVNRPRGLCWTCYYTPGLRERYASGSKYASRGEPKGNPNSRGPLPATTTIAVPGSDAKICVMMERAEKG